MPIFYFHTWRTQEYDHIDRVLKYLVTCTHISVNVSVWWLLLLFRCYVLVVAIRWVSPNSEPIVGAAFPRPSSREDSWTVHEFCSAAGSGEDKRVCVTKSWKEQSGIGEDWWPLVQFCSWVVSQYFLSFSCIWVGFQTLYPRPRIDTWWF